MADLDSYSASPLVSWHDPNSVRQNNVTSCTCRQSWAWDGKTSIDQDPDGLNTRLQTCWRDARTYFGAKLLIFQNARNFTLELAHNYKDDEQVPVGPVFFCLNGTDNFQELHGALGLPNDVCAPYHPTPHGWAERESDDSV